MSKDIIETFKLPTSSMWTKFWCDHEWGRYWKKLDKHNSTEQLVCRLCGKEGKEGKQ